MAKLIEGNVYRMIYRIGKETYSILVDADSVDRADDMVFLQSFNQKPAGEEVRIISVTEHRAENL